MFKKFRKAITFIMCALLVMEVVNCSGMLVKAEAPTMAARYFVLYPEYEKPNETPIGAQPKQNYSSVLNGEVYVNDSNTGEAAIYSTLDETCYHKGYTGEDVNRFLAKVPTDEEIASVVPGYDSKIHTVEWYVIKVERYTEEYFVHVDGIMLNKAPVETEAPVETQAPVETEAPVETQAPVETEAPVETQAPVETEAPVETQAPVEPQAPIATQAPVATSAPVAPATPAPTVIATPAPATSAPVVSTTTLENQNVEATDNTPVVIPVEPTLDEEEDVLEVIADEVEQEEMVEIVEEETPLASEETSKEVISDEVTIMDEESPLARNGHCWVHWGILILTLLYTIYEIVRIVRRKKLIDKYQKNENEEV